MLVTRSSENVWFKPPLEGSVIIGTTSVLIIVAYSSIPFICNLTLIRFPTGIVSPSNKFLPPIFPLNGAPPISGLLSYTLPSSSYALSEIEPTGFALKPGFTIHHTSFDVLFSTTKSTTSVFPFRKERLNFQSIPIAPLFTTTFVCAVAPMHMQRSSAREKMIFFINV